MALQLPPAATVLGSATYPHRKRHGVLTEVQYAHPDGNDANDGMTWGTAKQTILAAYDAGPSTGVHIKIAHGTKVGGEVTNQGIWLMGSGDSQFSSPPSGWRQVKPVVFEGVQSNKQLQFGFSGAYFSGGPNGGWDYDGLAKPAIWISGSSAPVRFKNLFAFYVSVGARIGISADQTNRSSNTDHVWFENCHFYSYNSGVFKSNPGNMMEIGYWFWGWVEHCTFGAYSPASRDSDQRVAVLVKPGAQSAGLIFFRDIISAGGGLKYYKGGTAWALDVDQWLHEGDFGSGEPATIKIVDGDGNGNVVLRNIGRADINPATSYPYDVSINSAVPAQVVLTENCGAVEGPHVQMNAYGAVNNTDMATQRAAGFTGGAPSAPPRVIAQHDGAARQFGPVAVRFVNLAAQDVTTWSSKLGSATVTTGQTAPDGTTNAAKLSASSLDSRQVYRAPRTLTVGDWVVGAVWAKPDVAGGVGGSPGAVEVGLQAAPDAGLFDTGTPYFGRDIDGIAGKWQWLVVAAKITTVNFTPGELIFSLKCSNGHAVTYYAPTLLHIPAGTLTNDELWQMAYHLNTYPEGAAAGNIGLLRDNKLIFGSDTNLYRSAADTLKTDDALNVAGVLTALGNFIQSTGGSFHEFLENGTTDAAAGGVNTGRLYVRDNGSGKTQLCVRFNTGAVQVLATEP